MFQKVFPFSGSGVWRADGNLKVGRDVQPSTLVTAFTILAMFISILDFYLIFQIENMESGMCIQFSANFDHLVHNWSSDTQLT